MIADVILLSLVFLIFSLFTAYEVYLYRKERELYGEMKREVPEGCFRRRTFRVYRIISWFTGKWDRAVECYYTAWSDYYRGLYKILDYIRESLKRRGKDT